MAPIDLTNEVTPVHPYRPVRENLSDLRKAIKDKDQNVLYSDVYLNTLNRNDLVQIVRSLGLALPTPYFGAAAWKATTAYSVGNQATVGAGIVQVTTAGTSAGTIPALPGSVGGTVTDGGVTWTRIK